MTLLRNGLIFFLTTLVAFSVVPVRAFEQRSDFTMCISNPEQGRCKYIRRYEDIREYEKPNTASRRLPTTRRGWGEPAQIDWSRVKGALPGWLPTSIPKFVGGDLKQAPYGWIEIKYIAHIGEFKRVTGCWPIASIKDTLGDAVLELEFTPDGGVLINNQERSNVLFTPNLLLVQEPKSGGNIVYGFDSKTRRLKHSGGDQRVTYFPFEKLKGCDGLKLEK